MDSEKIKPLTTYFIPIKEDTGYRIVIWPNNLLLEKIQKENGHWNKIDEFSLTRRAVEFIAARTPLWLSRWDEEIKKLSDSKAAN